MLGARQALVWAGPPLGAQEASMWGPPALYSASDSARETGAWLLAGKKPSWGIPRTYDVRTGVEQGTLRQGAVKGTLKRTSSFMPPEVVSMVPQHLVLLPCRPSGARCMLFVEAAVVVRVAKSQAGDSSWHGGQSSFLNLASWQLLASHANLAAASGCYVVCGLVATPP